jgi:hypothetical protein
MVAPRLRSLWAHVRSVASTSAKTVLGSLAQNALASSRTSAKGACLNRSPPHTVVSGSNVLVFGPIDRPYVIGHRVPSIAP